MSDKARYFDLVKRYPDRFTNVQGGIEILLDPAAITQVEQIVAARLVQQGLPPEWAEVGVAFQDQYMLILRDTHYPHGR
jgi:ADP-ribose pyrophosphatase